MARKPSSKKKLVAIVTFPGIEGVCAAAQILHENPGSQIFQSSKNFFPHTLSKISEQSFKEIHICGIGIHPPRLDEILGHLKKISKSKGKIFYYCGMGYLEEYRKPLELYAKCYFIQEGKGISETVYSVLFPDGTQNKQINRIRYSSMSYSDKGKLPKGALGEWDIYEGQRNLVLSVIWRMFNYDQMEAFPHAIRVFAGLDKMTEEDNRFIASYKRESDTYLKGRSSGIRKIKDTIKKCAKSKCSILISGETGTGKEIIARLIHEYSPRAGNVIACVNCANLTGSLLQDKLFGHAKGAFTDAHQESVGLFERANKGTLFLDEIGELELATQAQILRVLQEGTFQRLGDYVTDINTDVRIIAASNKDLLKEVEAGRFREDLYYRLAVIPINMPPLRERKEDIPAISRHILFDQATKQKIPVPELTPKQEKTLKSHHWPGNVRELENVLERFMILGEKDFSKLIDSRNIKNLDKEKILPLAEYTENYIRSVFESCDRNYTNTSKALGITRNTLKAKLKV